MVLSRFIFPHRLFYSPSHEYIHTHTLTYLHSYTQPLRDFLDFLLFCFTSVFFYYFWFKIDKYRPSFNNINSKIRRETKLTAKISKNKTNNKQPQLHTHFQKVITKAKQTKKKLKLKVQCERTNNCNNRICKQHTQKTHTHTHVKTTESKQTKIS